MKIFEYIEKTREYLAYLERHANNVKKAWELITDKCHDLRFIYDDYVYYEISNAVFNHDISKFCEAEFTQYRNWFYPVPGEAKNKEAFDSAWEHHKKNNLHHWEEWTKKEKYNHYADEVNCVHMVIDWVAMGFEMGDTAKQYYERNKDRIKLPKWAELLIYEIFDRIYEEPKP